MSGAYGLNLGPPLGVGREAEVYERGDASVVKLYRAGFNGHHTEAATLRALHGSGVAPALLDVVQHEGRAGLVIDRVAGSDMLLVLQRTPWRIRAIGRTFAAAHRTVHQIQAPAELADLRRVLADRIAEAGLRRRLRDFVSTVLDDLPDGRQLCHGDYHPGNVLLAAGRPSVIDWGAATRGAAEADHARTLLLLRWADPLPDTPLLSRALIGAGRSLLAATYARAYRQGLPPLKNIDAWLTVHAAARLAEGVPAERAILTRHLERALRRCR